jgi:hypothetical protein
MACLPFLLDVASCSCCVFLFRGLEGGWHLLDGGERSSDIFRSKERDRDLFRILSAFSFPAFLGPIMLEAPLVQGAKIPFDTKEQRVAVLVLLALLRFYIL